MIEINYLPLIDWLISWLSKKKCWVCTFGIEKKNSHNNDRLSLSYLLSAPISFFILSPPLWSRKIAILLCGSERDEFINFREWKAYGSDGGCCIDGCTDGSMYGRLVWIKSRVDVPKADGANNKEEDEERKEYWALHEFNAERYSDYDPIFLWLLLFFYIFYLWVF